MKKQKPTEEQAAKVRQELAEVLARNVLAQVEYWDAVDELKKALAQRRRPVVEQE